MKEFNLAPINKQVTEMLEEVLVELQKFEELKDCYIEWGSLKLKEKNLLTTRRYNGVVSIDNCFERIWKGIDLNREEVFEEIGDNLTSIKIKEPQPHQARKKTLEELEVGDSYYLFNTAYYNPVKELINDTDSYEKRILDTEHEIDIMKKYFKHARLFVALDEEEIKNKVLD